MLEVGRAGEDEGITRGIWRAMASYRLTLMLVLVLLGLALLLTVEWPNYTLHLIAFQSPLTVTMSLVWPMIGLLAVVMALGAAIIFRQHPSMRDEPALALLALWPLPTFTVGLAVLLLQRTMTGALWAGGIAITGLLLYALFRLEYVCLTNRQRLSVGQTMEQPTGEGLWAEWSLQVMAYLLAMAYFVLIYRARLRTLLSAPATLTVGGLLAMRLLHGAASDWLRGSMCALAIGFTLGEATWALNYWPGRSIMGGVLLLLIFYVFIGLARRGLEGRLTWSALLEYGVVVLLGLGLLIRFG